MQFTYAQLTMWLAPETKQTVGETAVALTGVTTDSRAMSAGQVFVALRGEHFDAHDFLDQVIAQGAAVVVVDHLPSHSLSVPAIVVNDTRKALGVLGTAWRREFTIPVIGVTGSNGKTTVKGMIAAILEAAFGEEHALSTRGNFNNDIGVPLTVFRLTKAHQAAVIELGMNHPGEIHTLTAIAQPTIGLINNAQREHQEFMATVEAVAKENGAVLTDLPENGIGVFPAGDEFTSLWRKMAGKHQVITFGLHETAHVKGSYTLLPFGSDMHVTIQTEKVNTTAQIQLNVVGEHNVKNALAAIACGVAAGVAINAIKQGLEGFVPVQGRLQKKSTKHGACLIDDTYNANPDSVRAAIDVLAKVNSPRILVLGDMGEVGEHGKEFHEEVGAYAQQQGVDYLFGFGELATFTVAAFNRATGKVTGQHFEDMTALEHAVEKVIDNKTTILVKGSRFMKMERVVQYLDKNNEVEGTH